MKLHRAWYVALAMAALAAAAPAAAWAQTHVAMVSVSGTVSGAPESVVFSGQASLANRLSRDPDFNHPSYVLTIDMRSVTGVGSTTLKKYEIAVPEIVQKSAAGTHVVDITFPFSESGSSTAAPRSGKASFAINFDVSTGAITAATGSVATPSFAQ